MEPRRVAPSRGSKEVDRGLRGLIMLTFVVHVDLDRTCMCRATNSYHLIYPFTHFPSRIARRLFTAVAPSLSNKCNLGNAAQQALLSTAFLGGFAGYLVSQFVFLPTFLLALGGGGFLAYVATTRK